MKKWRLKTNRKITQAVRAQQGRIISAARANYAKEVAEKHDAARVEAVRMWRAAKDAKQHPYARRKGVDPEGLRIHGGVLLIPVYNEAGKSAKPSAHR